MSDVAQRAQEVETDKERQFPPRNRGKFVPGNHYGGGRTAGSRQKLSDAFIATLAADFEAHGEIAIANVRKDHPAQYIKVIASLLPRDVNLNLTAFDSMTDEQLDRRLKTIKAMLEVRLSDSEGDVVESLKEIEHVEVKAIRPARSSSSTSTD